MDNKNKEAQFLSIPTMKEERMCGFLDASLINSGWAIATWCFLTGGLVAALVDFQTAVLTVFCGNAIGVVIMLIAEISPTVKYGVDTYPSIVSFLGRHGMQILLVCFVILNIGWVAVLSAMFSRSVQNMYLHFTGVESGPIMFTVVAIVAVLCTWLIVYKGLKVVKWMNRIVVPCIALMMVVMVYAIFVKYGLNAIMEADPLAPYENKIINIILCIELNVGAGLSWWASLGSLTRTTKSSRGAMWANMIGVNFLASVAVLLGAAAAYVIGGSDPTTWMIPLGGGILGVMALIFVGIGNLSSNAIVMYATCLGLKQYKFFANKSWLQVTLLFIIPIIILEFVPEVIYGNYQILLNGSAAFFSSLAAAQCIDFYIIRKEFLDLRSVYNCKPESGYYYWKGVNWGALICIAIGGIVYCLLLNPLTWEYSSALMILHSASIPAFITTFVLYFIYAKTVLISSGKGDSKGHKKYYESLKKAY